MFLLAVGNDTINWAGLWVVFQYNGGMEFIPGGGKTNRESFSDTYQKPTERFLLLYTSFRFLCILLPLFIIFGRKGLEIGTWTGWDEERGLLTND